MLNAWRGRGNGPARPERRAPVDTDRDRLPVAQVPISCGRKSHATIWRKTVNRVEDIPSADARRVLGSIVSVPGITRVTLGQFGRKGFRRQCQAWVGESTASGVIGGKPYDKGEKGTMQSFQVWVQSDEAKLAVAAEIESGLRNEDAWAG